MNINTSFSEPTPSTTTSRSISPEGKRSESEPTTGLPSALEEKKSKELTIYNNQIIHARYLGDSSTVQKVAKSLKTKSESNPELKPDTFTFNMLINHASSTDLREAQELIKEMKLLNVQPDKYTENIIKRVNKKIEDSQRDYRAELNQIVPFESVDKLDLTGVKEKSCKRLLEIAFYMKEPLLSLKIYEHMKSTKMKLDKKNYFYVLYSLIHHAEYDKAFFIMQEIPVYTEYKLTEIDRSINKQMLSRLCQAHKFQEAFFFYHHLPLKQQQKSVIRHIQLLIDWLVKETRIDDAMVIYMNGELKPCITSQNEHRDVLDHLGLSVGPIFLCTKQYLDKKPAKCLEICLNPTPLNNQELSQKEEFMQIINKYYPYVKMEEQGDKTVVFG